MGIEDPETGELIPSSGKRGRKKVSEGGTVPKRGKKETEYKAKYDSLLVDAAEKDARIKQLEHENKRLRFCLQKLRDTASEMLKEQDS